MNEEKSHSFELDFRIFMSPRGWKPPFDGYRSLFGFIWWFWLPRIHTQKPDEWNPIVIRLIWLCFAFNLDIWTEESKPSWPSNRKLQTKL